MDQSLKNLIFFISLATILLFNIPLLKSHFQMQNIFYLFFLRALCTLRDRPQLSTSMQMAFNFTKSLFVHLCFDSFMFGQNLLKSQQYLQFWLVHEGLAQLLVFGVIKKLLKADSFIRKPYVYTTINLLFSALVIFLFRFVNNFAVQKGFRLHQILFMQVVLMQLAEPFGATLFDFLVLREKRTFWLKIGLILCPMSIALIFIYRYNECVGHECEFVSGLCIFGYSLLLGIFEKSLPAYS